LLASAPPTGKTIGLVGGGPASLACAGTLALLGHDPVIYEQADVPGGLNASGVAPYKFKLADALAEVQAILELGVRVETGVRVGEDVSAETLLARHDAIFLGPGLGGDSRLNVPGEDGSGVVGAVEWIARLKTQSGVSVDGVRSAVVVGGGNTAIDVARELRGLGVESVTVLYRRPIPRMSAYEHELDGAKREGARVIDRAAVSEIARTGGRVTGVHLVETDDGRPTPRKIAMLPADLVILAIGQSRLVDLATSFAGVTCDASGRIEADAETGRTGNARVFAGGDARNGGKEVVNAVDEGQAAARAIDRMLRGAEASVARG
jgi:glutamate synthase (NADPH/NADH) small chain